VKKAPRIDLLLQAMAMNLVKTMLAFRSGDKGLGPSRSILT